MKAVMKAVIRGRLHVRIPVRIPIRIPIRFGANPISHTIRIGAYFKFSSVAGLCPFKRTEHFREKRTSSHFFIGEKDTHLFFFPYICPHLDGSQGSADGPKKLGGKII
jgi:hypothetical protein